MKKILRLLAGIALLGTPARAANTTISALPAASTLTGAEIVPIVQSAVTVQTTVGNLTQGMANATTSVPGLMSPTDKTTLTNATNAATASTLALRDASGNIAFHNIVLNAGTVAATPSGSTDIANKAYVDAAASGLTVKTAARVATTGSNIALSGLLTIDGVMVSAADRVLVKDQTDATQNGIYAAASGAWSRTTDANSGALLVTNSYVFVTAGSVNFSTGWIMTTPNPITIGSSNIVWALFSALGSIPASSITGQIISSQIAALAVTTAQFAANITPVEIVGTLPGSGNFAGRTVFLTSDNKLYRYNGSAFIASVAAVDLSGTINGTSQITSGSITAASIAANTITATQIAAGTITSSQIAAGTITASNIAANTLTAGTIAAGAIGTSQLAVGGVTGVKIANGTITATQIAASTITASNLNVSTLSAITANLGTVTAGTITGLLIQATGSDGTVTMDPSFGRFNASNGSAFAYMSANNPGTGSLGHMVLGYGIVPNITLESSSVYGGSILMKNQANTAQILLSTGSIGVIDGDEITNNGGNGNYTIPLKVHGDNNIISFEYAGSNTLNVKIDATVFTIALTP